MSSKAVDQYLAALDDSRGAALERLRRAIVSIIPDAVECISYKMPAFRYHGAVVAGFLATKKGCSYYPFSGRTLQTLAADLTKYERTKSALHFDPEKPLPLTLIRKLIKTRIAEQGNAGGGR